MPLDRDGYLGLPGGIQQEELPIYQTEFDLVQTQRERVVGSIILGLIFGFFMILFWLTLTLFYYPLNGSKAYGAMIHGENFALYEGPTFYHEVQVSSNATPGSQSLFYFKKCPKLNMTRLTFWDEDFRTERSKIERFYLNKNSVVNYTWGTTEKITFSIYRGSLNFRIGDPTTVKKKSDGQTNKIFKPDKSAQYYFVWDLEKSDHFNGSLSFDFNLTSYDTTFADESCDLGMDLPPCKFKYNQSSSCIVTDVFDMDYEGKIDINVRAQGKGGKYFGLVMLPSLILCLLFILIAIFIAYLCKATL